MATIKSYSDLQQSKKLAEILPLESADRYYPKDETTYAKTLTKYEITYANVLYGSCDIRYFNICEYTPCWSLAALIEVLPNSTNIVKEEADTENEKYMCTIGVTNDIISTFGNNPVDACFEMILKLKRKEFVMKAYTDLEQSKKLAEFLSLESADMHYHYDYDFDELESIPTITEEDDHFVLFPKDVRCWSLVALLGVLPQINDWITPHGHKNDKLSQFEPKICKLWEHCIVPSYKVTYGNELSTDIYDNPVDACVEMIIKLKERKML